MAPTPSSRRYTDISAAKIRRDKGNQLGREELLLSLLTATLAGLLLTRVMRVMRMMPVMVVMRVVGHGEHATFQAQWIQ